MTVLVVIAAVVLAVSALLMLDWFAAGRIRRRISKSAPGGDLPNPNASLAYLEGQAARGTQRSP